MREIAIKDAWARAVNVVAEWLPAESITLDAFREEVVFRVSGSDASVAIPVDLLMTVAWVATVTDLSPQDVLGDAPNIQ